MNDKMPYSSKRAKRSVYHMVTRMIGIIVSSCLICGFYYTVLVKACGLFDEDFFHLPILTMLHRIFNIFTIPLYLFTFAWYNTYIFPGIYGLFGTETIFISDDFLTINKHALFLNKTKMIEISDIVKIEYNNSQRLLPDVLYDSPNDNNVRIIYYKRHHLFKWSFYCGLNFTEEECVKFASTLNKEPIKKNRFLWLLRKNST
ncbi:MAG: hypothetical protein MJZ95_03670 [Paludibacteraceae bacterium]|nr:hypothetical protein [Paludibacteraceae bacterium]